jgi:adenine/guanine phosphoribosyltransferase-like PRPP-binding protein
MDDVLSFDLSRIGKNSSIGFASKLHASKILSNERIERVIISFQGLHHSDYLRIVDLATITAIIRFLAERGIKVTVKWPRPNKGRPSRLQKVLEGIKFASLFKSYNIEESWVENVDIIGRKQHLDFSSRDPSSAHYLPMLWFDSSLFISDDIIDDYWTIRPSIPSGFIRDLRDCLYLQGFLDDDSIDVFINVMFMEIAWNVILHSSDQPGAGFGLFCGQIIHPGQGNSILHSCLNFCLVDVGRGIPRALGSFYDEYPDKYRISTDTRSCSRSTRIVRFALDRYSSSRPRHASQLDYEGCRGLAYVANALEGSGGQISIRSNGGGINVVGKRTGAKATPNDNLIKYPLPGTQVSGVLYSKLSRSLNVEVPVKSEVSIHFDFHKVYNVDGTINALVSPERASEYINELPRGNRPVLIFDLGCVDLKAREIEYLCKVLIERFSNHILILWNIRIKWSLLKGFNEWLYRKHLEGLKASIIVVKSWHEGQLLGVPTESNEDLRRRLSEVCGWLNINSSDSNTVILENSISAKISPHDWLEISKKLNTSMLDEGFMLSDEKCGFYKGNIHLLSGEVVDKFFSFSRNTHNKKANLERWVRSTQCAIHLAYQMDLNSERLLLLGFTGTVRDLIYRLKLECARIWGAIIILSHDMPSVEEIRRVVKPNDNVLLLADVISTGSSAKRLSELVRRAGGIPVGIIAAVDARQGPSQGSDNFDVGYSKLPFYGCALSNIVSVDPRTANQLRNDLWIDPISFIPSRQQPSNWGIPELILNRVDYTLNAVCETNSAKCGHCVDGTRHMSVYIDLRRLIFIGSHVLLGYIKESIFDRLKKQKWGDFSPTHIVYPTGIARLEVLHEGFGKGNDVLVYNTAVKSYASFLRSFWPNSIEVEILRSFDPGGNSRCADVVEEIRDSPAELGDVILADDGIWSGRTVSSILNSVVESGAKRVLVIPMLARMRTADVVHWESIRSIRNEKRNTDTPICCFFPFIYPVPAYNSEECPYEISKIRILQRSREYPLLMEIGKRRAEELRARTPGDISIRDKNLTSAWVKTRCYLELASESEYALEKTLAIMRDTKSENGIAGILEMFLGEWQVVGRARIRQSIFPVLKKMTIELAVSEETSDSLRLLAITVLRSLDPEEYARIVFDTSRFANSCLELLERSIFHVATFDEEIRSKTGCVKFLRKVCDIPKNVTKDMDIERAVEIVAFARRLLFQIKKHKGEIGSFAKSSPTVSASRLLELISSDGYVQHELRPMLNNLDESRGNLKLCSPKTWELNMKNWEETIEPLISEIFMPEIINIQDILIRAATPLYQFEDTEVQYFIAEGGDSEFSLALDASTVGACLNFLSKERNLWAIDVAGDAANRIYMNICGDKIAIRTDIERASRGEGLQLDGVCLLGKILLELRKWPIAKFVENLDNEIDASLATRGLRDCVEIRGLDNSTVDGNLFLPNDLVVSGINHITDNLLKYAFRENSTTSPNGRVQIDIESIFDEQEEDRSLLVTIRDNGYKNKDFNKQGRHGKHLNSAMEIFGGSLLAPKESLIPGWSTEQYLRVNIW